MEPQFAPTPRECESGRLNNWTKFEEGRPFPGFCVKELTRQAKLELLHPEDTAWILDPSCQQSVTLVYVLVEITKTRGH